MKIREVQKVPKNKIGHFNENGVKPEPGEEGTIKYLTLFGFDIEFIRPSSTKKAKNPDVLIMGTIWEIKTPTSSNENTIKMRFRDASKQAEKIIFDLRGVKKNPDKVERQIMDLFMGDGRVRHMMLIKKDGRLLDIVK